MDIDTKQTFYLWSSLGEDLAGEIVSFLPYQTALAVHQTCKHAQQVQTKAFSTAWQLYCEQIWLTDTIGSCSSWYARFMSLCHEIGPQFIHIYARVGKCWKRLYEWVSQHAPMVASNLSFDGVDVSTLLAARATAQSIGLTLPLDLLCWYRIRDGQHQLLPGTGLCGGFQVYDLECNLHLLPFQHLAHAAFQIAQRHKRLMIPLTTDCEQSPIDFYMNSDGCVIRYYAQSRGRDGYIVSTSYIEWMETYVNRLYAGHHAVHPQTGICRFPSGDGAWGSDTITEGIRIQVGVLFVPEQSMVNSNVTERRASKYFFTYKVRITFVDPHSNMRGRLTTRTWLIKDGRGHTERVHGPGVIGEYPEVYDGMEPFEYVSCTPLSTRTGEMSGSFQFAIDGRDEELRAKIDPFILNVDTNYN